ncbi:MAG: Flp family type IVb pilin [Bdellovibrionales bacterium]|nr:Flp family type IVb pilin [Bdellovibrionales bacterium]
MKNQNGQGVLEYLILVALVALVCVGGAKALGGKLHTKIGEVKDQIDSGIPVRLNPR